MQKVLKHPGFSLMAVLFLLLSMSVCVSVHADADTESEMIAQEHLNIGNSYMEQQQFVPAITEFEKALQINPNLKEAKKQRDKAHKFLKKQANVHFNQGEDLYKQQQYDQAIVYFEETLKMNPGHRGAKRYLAKAKMKINPTDDDILLESTRHIDDKNQKIKKAQVAYILGRDLYLSGDYEAARDKFEDALELNPYHVPARRFLEAIISREREYVDTKLDLTYQQRMVDTRSNWIEKRDKKVLVSELEPWKVPSITPSKEQLLEKAQQIIPEINFNEAKLSDVIKYLSGITGINIIIDESVFSPSIAVEEAETISITDEEEAVTTSPRSSSDRVTISLKNVPLLEAMKYILRPKGLKYTIEDFAIIITSATYIPPEDFETRYYHLSSGVGSFTTFDTSDSMEEDEFSEGEESSQATITIKDVLEQSGVPWPAGSKIFLDQRTGTLIVRNTPSNLTIIEDILRTLDVTPYQVMIQARFVELSDTEAEDLGLEWMLNDDWKFFNADGNKYVPLASRERVQFDKTDLTQNMRFLNTNSTSGSLTTDPVNTTAGIIGNGLFSISGILTRPEFSVVIHALDQTGRANTLSSPQVTTINGQRAQIEVVREIIYPTEYEITAATTNEAGTVVTPPVVTPGSFETRDVGIILDVTPNVGADRKTINLTIIPEVSELVEWIDYGMPEWTPKNTSSTGDGTPPIPINQPIFKTQNVTTSVIVNDGETVVLGGLITELQEVIDDKIPFLGDIPLLGNLFKKHSEVSSKKNLLIFVTAELITPSGDPYANVKGQQYDE